MVNVLPLYCVVLNPWGKCEEVNMNCKNCKIEMDLDETRVRLDPIALLATYRCDVCGVKAEGWFMLEELEPDPVFWRNRGE